MKRVVVSGSRSIKDAVLVFRTLDRLASSDDLLIVHGDAPGPDTYADVWAQLRSPFDPERHPAAWRENGVFNPRAGFDRNEEMLDVPPRPDLVVAFWDGRSRGTKHTIEEAHKRGIPVEEVRLGPGL